MKRLARLIKSGVVNGDVHPRKSEIERAVLRVIIKAGMDGKVSLWPSQVDGGASLMIKVDKVRKRLSQMALGMIGDYCADYIMKHYDLEIGGVYWSIHSSADINEESNGVTPTTIGYMVEEMSILLSDEEMTMEKLIEMTSDIQNQIQKNLMT